MVKYLKKEKKCRPDANNSQRLTDRTTNLFKIETNQKKISKVEMNLKIGKNRQNLSEI